jgi:hypothetical protein
MKSGAIARVMAARATPTDERVYPGCVVLIIVLT